MDNTAIAQVLQSQYVDPRNRLPDKEPASEEDDLAHSGAELGYFPFTNRSKRGLPRSGAKVGSILSQPGER